MGPANAPPLQYVRIDHRERKNEKLGIFRKKTTAKLATREAVQAIDNSACPNQEERTNPILVAAESDVKRYNGLFRVHESVFAAYFKVEMK